MKAVELISRILNFSIITLAILGVGLLGLGNVTYMRSDISEIFILAMFLVNLGWVVNAIRCYANAAQSGVKTPKLISVINASTLVCYVLFIILVLIDAFHVGHNRLIDEGEMYFSIFTCGLMVIDWIVCSLYLSKYVREEAFILNKRSAGWIGGALLILLSGIGIYGVSQCVKPLWYGKTSDRIVENHYRYAGNKLVDITTQKIVLKNYDSLVLPKGTDSLALFFKDRKRGYINLSNGEIVVPSTTYTHAWVFSEGLAAVEKDGKIGFINSQGEVVIDFLFDYKKSVLNSFCFHNGRCRMLGENMKKGVIDRQGKWKIQPEYDYIAITTDYVVAGKKGELRKMIDFDGHVIQENIFDSSHDLTYEKHYLDKDGDDRTYYQHVKGICVYKVDGLEGLMTDEARIITPPVYESIWANDEQHFKATLKDGNSEVWLNRKGEVINSHN